MESIRKTEVLALRAHHICCLRFWSLKFEERGPEYIRVLDKIKSILRSHPDFPVMVAEGIDTLCRGCPYCVNERCVSPQGHEDEVRKWDAIILRELAVPMGSCLTSSEWQKLLRQKLPFKLCARCQWRQTCSAGEEVS